MKKIWKIVLSIGIVLAVVVCIFVVSATGSIISFNNRCVSQEEAVIAQYDQDRNNYDNYFKKVKEVCQVPEMYVDAFKQVYDPVMQGNTSPSWLTKIRLNFNAGHRPLLHLQPSRNTPLKYISALCSANALDISAKEYTSSFSLRR